MTWVDAALGSGTDSSRRTRSGLTGTKIMNRTSGMQCPWLNGISLFVIASAALFSAGLATASTPAAGVQGHAPIERDGAHDFDFIFGHWKIHLKRRASAANGANTWTQFDGYGRYRKIWDGRANLNEFEADSPSGHIEGLTLRTYNPKTRQWSLYWASSGDGILAEPQVGQFHDGVGEFYAQDKIDGKSVFVRYVWSKITANSVHFEQAFSVDGGKTWDVNWISDMKREPGASANASAAAEARPASTISSAQDGQHDFDPLLGSWKYDLQRRSNPLTGSTTWVDLSGTGVCYRLWDGRAQLDTILVNGEGEHIEGLTLRLYSPKSHEWRLYWANSKDGVVVVPQIGQFNNGHGEFYAQDTLNDRSIFVKFDWTGLSTASPHFEQSFSGDGGKTWEVNWITDQTRQGRSP
jgi:hypothetical protein